jgi:hypothetical protein
VLVGLWYVAYCYKICPPEKKFSLFAKHPNNPLDLDLVQLIFVRAIIVAGGVFSCTISITYSITGVWLLLSIPLASRIAVAAGAIYVVFLSVKSSLKAIHDHFNNKQDKVE